LSTFQMTTQELWTLTNQTSTWHWTMEWSSCQLDWTMDDSTISSWQDLNHQDHRANISIWKPCLATYNDSSKHVGHLPTKIQHDIEPWNEVHVNLIGPWMIPQCPYKSPKLSTMSDVKQLLQVLTLNMIDPSTNLLKLIVV
jgi:hypothetical protein